MSTIERARGSLSVAERARRSDEEQGYTWINVGPTERLLSVLTGSTLAALGLRRGTLGGLAMSLAGGALVYRGVTGHCDMYDALNLDSAHTEHAITHMHKGILVRESYTINRSPEECYQFWRKLENLPRFMTHLRSVRELDERRSRWEARAPMGRTVAWDAEIITDRPNELIAWKSVGDSDIDHAGSVAFRPAPGNRGTEVTVELNYEPPAGQLGRAISWMFGEEPEIQVREDLRHFKQFMETGEIPTTEGQPSCRA